MKKHFNIVLAFSLVSAVSANGQNEIDALRYGSVSGAATARALSLGGAGGSLGGDFSSLSINPAGLGIYRSSEIMLTPTLLFNGMKGTYLGQSSTEDMSKVGLNNFGIVFNNAASGKSYESSDWKSFSLGIGYNRIANFNDKGYYQGKNSESSITEIFSADALYNGVEDNMIPPFGFFGYQGFLLYDDLGSIAYDRIISQGGSVLQSKSWKTDGGINEWSLSIGGNYKEKLMLGAGLSLTSYSYERKTNYLEEDATGNTNNDFDFLSMNEKLKTTGLGFNFKIGAIYVVNNSFRLGASIHSPTWSGFTDNADYDITTNTERLKAETGQSDPNPITYVQPRYPYAFDYSLRTPWKGVLSATAFMGRHGFITADYEYTDYGSMRYTFRDYDGGNYSAWERSVNQAIKDTYKAGHTLKIGVEGKADNFMGRLGFAYHSSPFKKSDLFGGDRMDFSVGVGGRFGNFFVDLAYVRIVQNFSEYYYPMLVQENPALGIRKIPVGLSDIKSNRNLIALTMGLKF